MKKSLFVLLIAALCAAAFFTRPQDPKASFTSYLADHKSNASVVPVEWTDLASRSFAESCEYKDRYLWVDVKFEGKNVPRAFDLMLHNDKNTPPFPLLQGPVVAIATRKKICFICDEEF